MKKFLNYILVAGVAVLGFVGAANAAKLEADAANTAFDNIVNNTLKDGMSVAALNNTTDGNVLTKAADDAAKALKIGEGYRVVANTVDATNKTVTLDLQEYDADNKEWNTTAIKSSSAINLKFDASELTKVISAEAEALGEKVKAYDLTDLELVQYLVNTKDETTYTSAIDSIAAFSKDKASKSGYSIVLEEGNVSGSTVTYPAFVKYGKNYVATAEVVVTVKAEVLVPTNTKSADAAKVIESRIKTVPGVNSVMVIYDEDAATATINVNNKKVNGTFTVTPSDKAGNYNAPADATTNSIASNSTNVTVTSDKAVAEGTKLVVNKVENPTEAAKAVAKDVKDIVVYEIKLVDADDKEVKFDGVTYTVTVTIPENLKGKELAAYTVVDGKLEEHKITVDGDKGTFKTTHFSEWIISEVVKVDENGKVLPNTLDNAASFAFVGVIGLVGMAASALFLNKRN